MKKKTDSRLGFAVDLNADEVIRPGRTLHLTFKAPVDPKSAQGAVRVLHGGCDVPVRVSVDKRRWVVAVQIDETRLGGMILAVTELLGSKGERLVDRFRLPFSVVPISGKIPEDFRVEHAARLALGELGTKRLAPGETAEVGHVDVVKAVHRSKGTPVELAFDERGERVDFPARLAEIQRRRAEKFGRLHETLFELLEKSKDGDRIPVLIWPRLDFAAAPFEKPVDRRLDTPHEAEAKTGEAWQKAVARLRTILQRAKMELPKAAAAADGIQPIRVVATVDQIRGLARHADIGGVFLDDTSAIADLGDSLAVARSERAHLAGFDGTGIRVAVWEDGPSVTTNLDFAGRFTTTPAAKDHARLTCAVVKNTEANRPHGHAPDCDLYSANSSDAGALRWAIRDQHCTVVSQSFHRSTEPGGSGLQSDDLLKDLLALRWPYPMIVQAAGNFWLGDLDNINPPENEYVNHKGYNSLAIGNHDDTAAAMSGDSVFRNPTSPHGDRELPELAANGTGVSANGQTMSGTSFAAPATAGVTALLQDVDSVLCSWPEGCRAILMAAAGRNVSGNTWWQDVVARVDGRDGAGAVDAQVGVWIAQQRRPRNAAPSRRGWDVGTLSSAVVGPDRLATFRHRISVPILLLAPRVKVALAWDSAVTSSGDTATASTLTVDLDLLVRDSHGTQVASAVSWDNSYEVVEFDAVAGETYEIVIRRWSGTDSVWYGVAWNVTGLFRFLEFNEFLVNQVVLSS
jgi:hypothetical protein